LAERYIKEVSKVLSKGSVYICLGSKIFRMVDMHIKDLDASVTCQNIRDEKQCKIQFRVNKDLLYELVRFGLQDKKNSIFMVSVKGTEPRWFETSVDELTDEVAKAEIKKNLGKKLQAYENIEER